MTMAASTACGSRPRNGASTSIVAAAAPAVTSDAFWVRPPTERTTAVCDVPPPAGMAPKKAPEKFAAPVASNSRLGLMGGSGCLANARPRGDRLSKTHQGDAEGPGQQLQDQAEARKRDRGQRLRNHA